MEMGSPFSEMELASFMSLSKGYMGECGLRGGWMELVNMEKEVQEHLFKGISSNLCPTSLGQAGMDCVVSVAATSSAQRNCCRDSDTPNVLSVQFRF